MCVRRREVDLPVTTPVAYTRVMAALAARGATAEPMWPPGAIRALRSMSLLSWGGDHGVAGTDALRHEGVHREPTKAADRGRLGSQPAQRRPDRRDDHG
jgi:hypothetical protein